MEFHMNIICCKAAKDTSANKMKNNRQGVPRICNCRPGVFTQFFRKSGVQHPPFPSSKPLRKRKKCKGESLTPVTSDIQQ